MSFSKYGNSVWTSMCNFYAILKCYDFIRYSTSSYVIFVVVYFEPLYALFARVEEYAVFL